MKDWKSELSKLKNNSTLDRSKKSTESELISRIDPTISLHSQLLPNEKIILERSKRISLMTEKLEKLSLKPLEKGNAKLIKNFQQELQKIKVETVNLIYKTMPHLLKGNKLPNSNALLIEVQTELIEKDNRYQAALRAQANIKFEKEDRERQIRLQKESEEVELKKVTIEKKIFAAVKKYDLQICQECNDGQILTTCSTCFGSGRVDKPYKSTVVERFTCGNLRPNCEKCGGLGVYSLEREALTYQCPDCSGGKLFMKCEFCLGSRLIAGKSKGISKNKFKDFLDSHQSILTDIKKFLLKSN